MAINVRLIEVQLVSKRAKMFEWLKYNMLADGHESCFEKLDTIFPGSNSNKLRSKFEQTRPSPEKMATMRGIESSRNFAKYFSPSTAAAFRRNRQWLFGPWKS
jgi:hypothetical protein